MKEYYEDSIYHTGSKGEVFDGKPGAESGNEGDERWCWVSGEGLFLAKKYHGEWRFFSSSTELLEAGELSGDSTSSGGGGTTSAPTGQFTNLTVTNSSALQTATGISGTLSVTATTLSAFPHSDNLALNSSVLDTIQHIKTSSAPQFSELGLGTAASGEAGNIELTSVLGVNATSFINSALFLHKENYTNTAGTALTDGLNLGTMTQVEAKQLLNIDSSTISSDQWGYLGNMDQDVTQTSNVRHSLLYLKHSGSSYEWSLDPDNDGNLAIEPPGNNDRYIRIGKSGQDDVTLKSYGYTSGLFTGDGWSIYEDNNKHNMELDNLSVRGTLSVFELLIQQIRATNGAIFVTSACKLGTDGDALYHVNVADTYTMTFQSDEDDDKPHPFANGDLILARRVDIGGDNTDVVTEVRFTVTDITTGNASQLSALLVYASMGTGAGAGQIPTADFTGTDIINGFDFVRVGNTTDLHRQGGLYLTSDDTLSPFMDVFNEVGGWEQWDGITSAFQFNNGAFDGLTWDFTGSSNGQITGTEWYHSTGVASHSVVASGGPTNDSYFTMSSGSGGVKIYQAISFPYISSGTYTVDVTWYAKSAGLDEGRVAIVQNDPIGGSMLDYFSATGTYTNATSGSTVPYVNMTDITAPSAQPDITTEWQKYSWRLTITTTAAQESRNHFIVFSTASGTGKDLQLDNIRFALPGKVKTRVGNIEGVGATGYGLWGENVWLTGRMTAQSGYIGDELQGWEINSTGIKNSSTNTYISSGQTAVGVDNDGIFLGGAGTFSAGDSSTEGIKWDGSALTVRGTVHVGSGGTVDSSLLPSTGKNFKIVAVGKNGSTATAGVFKANASGIITDQVSGAPDFSSTAGGTLMVFHSGDDDLDSNFSSDGVAHYNNATTMSTAINGLANGKLVGIMIHKNCAYWLNSAYETAALILSLKKCGGSDKALESTSVQGAYILIGTKDSVEHTQGTELVSNMGTDSSNPHYISLTANFRNNVIDILDWEGNLQDFDAEYPKTYSHSRVDGFQSKRIDLDDNYQRALWTFSMPHVNLDDTSNVYLFMTSKNLSDEGVAALKMWLNGNEITAITESDLQDPDATGAHVHEFHNIPSQYFKVGIGDVNAFQLTANADGTTSDTMYIYDFELRSSTTGATYTSGSMSSPEGNVITNPGFEVGSHGDTSITGWTTTTTHGTWTIDNTVNASGMQSLKVVSNTTQAADMSQVVSITGGKTYVLRFKYRFTSVWGATAGATISLYGTDVNTTGTIYGSFDLDDEGAQTWGWAESSNKQYFPFDYTQTGSFEDTQVNQWQTYELQFTVPATNSFGNVGTTDWTLFFYTGGVNGQIAYFDHIQFFQVADTVTSEEKGLYMTGDRMGFYNGTGGFNGWSSLIKDDGTFFFGSKSADANLVTPSTGGPFIRFFGDKLQVNADLIAGTIKSENLTTTVGTQINLADGTLTTAGTDTDTGLVVAVDGSITTNGATIDGGTITGTLMQSAFAEGDVDFVTEYIGAGASAYQQTEVNGVRRLLCNRVCDSVSQTFALNTENSATNYHTKPLNIWLYNVEQPSGGSGITAKNRVAGTAASTNVTVNMNSFPMINYSWFTKNGESTTKECFAMRFRIEDTAYHFYFRGGIRVDDDGGGDGGECHIGFDTISSGDWATAVASYSSSTIPGSWGGYNILDHDGEGGDDEGDYADANTTTISCGSYTFVAFAEIRHEQEGFDNTLIATLRIYMTGTGSGMEGDNGALTRVGVDLKKMNNGSHIVDRSVMFPEGFFRVYN